MNQTTINGERVALHPKSISDAPRDYIWQKDAALAGLCGQKPLKISFIQYLTRYATGHSHPDKEQFAIRTLVDSKHIGNCAIYDIDRNRAEAQMGIIIGDRRFWGQGYGTDAFMTLISYAFNQLGMRRLYLKTLEDNRRARNCFARCGFKTCGSLLENGHTYVLMEQSYEDYVSRELASMKRLQGTA